CSLGYRYCLHRCMGLVMKVTFNLPNNTPAQVRSWVIDFNRAKDKGDIKSANELGGKINRYLTAVKRAGGKALQPPVTKAERDIAYNKNHPRYTKLTYGRMY
ncbi:MAG: hypothetical protein ACRC6V_18030, partial [Bacteroidales bacterium]